jgi:hypothetical protein
LLPTQRKIDRDLLHYFFFFFYLHKWRVFLSCIEERVVCHFHQSTSKSWKDFVGILIQSNLKLSQHCNLYHILHGSFLFCKLVFVRWYKSLKPTTPQTRFFSRSLLIIIIIMTFFFSEIFKFMLRLFLRKMISVVKWFQESYFSEKYFLPKAFFGVWHVQKITNIFHIFIQSY